MGMQRNGMTEVQGPNGTSNDLRIGRTVSLDDAAMLLGVSRRTVYNRIRDGRLQTIRTLGGSQRVVLESMLQPGALGPWQPALSPITALAMRRASGY